MIADYKTKLWEMPAPVVLNEALSDERVHVLTASINKFNSCFKAGYDFVIFEVMKPEKARAKGSWIKLVETAHFHSDIGRQGGEQIVSVNPTDADGSHKERTPFHELCHALGMAHEQYHVHYPLENPKVIDALLSTGRGERPFTLENMVKHIEENKFVSLGPCDFQSIMMYGRFRSAARAVDPTITEPETYLSETDIRVLKNIYQCNGRPLPIGRPNPVAWCEATRKNIKAWSLAKKAQTLTTFTSTSTKADKPGARGRSFSQ
ncbi:M12 family metallopeptidase [Rubrimonas cliftonensis]|uniref:M12 family metallopeptidase n=1 Tax=Rubrimonas cliftonensis TaxID=89524 RepID=UPI0015873E5C|nr:M12 family metallopeptidase [Rubrimonas cliftonensis]